MDTLYITYQWFLYFFFFSDVLAFSSMCNVSRDDIHIIDVTYNMHEWIIDESRVKEKERQRENDRVLRLRWAVRSETDPLIFFSYPPSTYSFFFPFFNLPFILRPGNIFTFFFLFLTRTLEQSRRLIYFQQIATRLYRNNNVREICKRKKKNERWMASVIVKAFD